MDPRSAATTSPLYLLERFEVGIIHLDPERRVIGMNQYARQVLPVDEVQPFDRMVLAFHPERSQPKVSFLLDQAAQCPVSNPPPMTMLINIPERVLLIKVSRMTGQTGQITGYTLIFYDITEAVSKDEPPAGRSSEQRRQLQKIPTVSGQNIVLVDEDEVLCIRSEGHYTRVCTGSANRFCNLAISDLEARLDTAHFMRVHRSHIVNLRAVDQVLREDGRLQLRLRGSPEVVPVSRSSAAAVLARLGVPGATRSG